MRLYGRALADQVPTTTTGHQAREMFGQMTEALSGAYSTLESYGDTGALGAIVPGASLLREAIDGEAIAAARQYLDSTHDMLQRYFHQMPVSNEVLSDLQLQQLRTSVSGTSTAVREIDQLFATTWLNELSDSIVESAGTVSAQIASTVAKVGGSFIGGMWWLIALGLGALVVWHKWGHKVVT
jgi:hypothetical protein